MLDKTARRVIDPLLDAVAAPIVAMRIPANAISVVGFLFGAAACVAIAIRYYPVGMALILLNRLADGLDGCVARRTAATDLGGFLDIVFDMIFYSGVPFAFAVADPSRWLPAAFLIYSFVGTGSSFLAWAAISEKRRIASGNESRKSFVYSAGLMEGTETVLFFFLICLLPQHFVLLAWTFGILCWVTTALRIAAAIREFR